MKLNKTFAILSAFSLCIVSAEAQIPVHGIASVSAGYEDAIPWAADIKLAIPTEHIILTPYLNIEGITPTSSERQVDQQLIFSKTGNRYESSEVLKGKGFDLKYGTNAFLPLASGNAGLNITYHGRNRREETDGCGEDRLYTWQLFPNSYKALSNIHMPHLDNNSSHIKAAFNNIYGFIASYEYRFDSDLEEIQRTLDGSVGHTYGVSDRNTESKIHFHHANVAKAFSIESQTITTGLDFERRSIDRQSKQSFGSHVNSTDLAYDVLLGDLNHRYQTAKAYMGYAYHNDHVALSAQIGYAFTHMRYDYQYRNSFVFSHWFLQNEASSKAYRSWDLHDWIPQVHFTWNTGTGDTLRADYLMLVKRPDAALLDATRIYGLSTIDYGNLELEGIHINNITLAYQIARDKFSYTTTLGGIIVEDGFNAIWMEKDDIRISTWGNEGVRRAYSITPDLTLKPSAKTTLTARATLMWDKRIARAINMAKEHWGIRSQVGINQVLPKGFHASLKVCYSEGNTFDLYSHEASKWEGNATISKTLLSNRLNLSLSYDYQDYDKLILTQGAYTGRITRMEGHHGLTLQATCKF